MKNKVIFYIKKLLDKINVSFKHRILSFNLGRGIATGIRIGQI